MTKTPLPPEPDRAPSPSPVENPAEIADSPDLTKAPAGATDEESGGQAGSAEEMTATEASQPSSHEDVSLSEPTDEVIEAPDEIAEQPLSPIGEVSLFVASDQDHPSPSPKSGARREMGWKMMAVAGILLLSAGFAAGIFFPEAISPDEEMSTTTATTPAAESSVPSTSAPAVTAPSTPAVTAAPSTTVAPATTVPDIAAAEVEAAVVEPPKLVITDEPVGDVANRLVPSVVHLEIQSDNLFQQGAGSGVIFDSRGYILTAAHVVSEVAEGTAELTVRLSTGDRLPGEVVGTDPDSDIAVVKVERSGLTPAELSMEDPLRVGQLVVAVGSPWGLESSVTSGVISAVDRIVEGKLLTQSDAVLYPGNSGGALADRYGRLIGINVSIFTDSTSLESIEFQGVGFAVPIDVAYRVAQALIAGEPVHTAFLGISGRDTQGDAGVEIMEVFAGSGAEQAGLKPDDVVVGVGGRPVTGIADLAARIRHLSPGDVIILDVLRGEDRLTLAATLLPRSEVVSSQDEPAEDSPPE